MENGEADLLEHVYTEEEKEFLLRIIKTKIAPILESLARGGLGYAWEQWMMEVKRQRAIEAAIKLRKDVVNVLKYSTRGNRTQEEKDLIHQYVSKNLSCIPDDITHHAMDILCNEIDFYHAVDAKSIMFLQGDYGNCYYMIGDGKVDLYLVQGKDKEMEVGREYGGLRGTAYTGDNFAVEILKEDVREDTKTKSSSLATNLGQAESNPSEREVNIDENVSPVGTNSAIGKKIVTLEKGRGFGEFAILSTAGKIRMCSAVAATSNTLCFILHANTYNTVLKQHHYRSSKLSAATALLTTMPVFNSYSAAKLSNIAFSMTATMHQNTAVIAKAGTKIKKVLVVHTGTVRVVQERSGAVNEGKDGLEGHNREEVDEDEDDDYTPTMTEILLKRLPRLAVSVLGKGSIIGETEILQNRTVFQMTYMANSNDCEVFELPVDMYRECCMGETVSEHQADLMKEKALFTKKRDVHIRARLERADNKIKKIALERAQIEDDKAALLKMLPVLIGGVTMEGAAGLESVEPRRKTKKGDYFRHRDATSQEIVDANLQIMKHNTRHANDTGDCDSDQPYGYDPCSSDYLESALGQLPKSPPMKGFDTSGDIPGAARSPFSPARVRLGSRLASREAMGSRAVQSLSQSPRLLSADGTRPATYIRRDGYSPVTSPEKGVLLDSMLTTRHGVGAIGSPMGSPRSKPSPRQTRVLSASSYRN